MQGVPLLGKVITLVVRDEVDDRPLAQDGWLIENETRLFDLVVFLSKF